MNHADVHVSPGEIVTGLNYRDPASPFTVTDLSGDWHHASDNPNWCRRIAAELLEAATEHDSHHANGTGQRGRQAHEAFPP